MGSNLSVGDAESQKGRVAIVTGANSGLGLETSMLLASLGCTVILACRSEDKANQAMDYIEKSCKASGVQPDLRFIPLDLCRLQSVQQFYERFLKTGLPLHYLICNAAVFGIPHGFTSDGYENHFQVNYLSHFLLTILLLPTMMESGTNCRVVNVSAKLHEFATLEMDNIHGEKRYSRIGFYNKSKLYQIQSMYTLQKLVSKSDIIMNSLHPGVIETNIQKGILDNTWSGWFYYGVKSVLSFPPVKYLIYKCGIMRGAEDAALSIVYMAISPKVADKKCIYFNETVPTPTSPEARNEEKQTQLFKYSLTLVDKYIPEETRRQLKLDTVV